MDQHETITDLADEVRRLIVAGDEAAARALFARLLGILESHTGWEERGLFARMLAQGDFAEHVVSLEAEHVALHEAVAGAGSAPEGWGHAVTTLLAALDTHIYRENYGLFPGALAVLDAEDWDAIDETEAGPVLAAHDA